MRTTHNYTYPVHRKKVRVLSLESLRVSRTAEWMASNRLKINPAKPQFMWCVHYGVKSAFRLADDDVVPTSYVRNLGAYFDASMSMAIYVSRLVSTCFYQLRRVRAIRRSIPTSTAEQLINSFVISLPGISFGSCSVDLEFRHPPNLWESQVWPRHTIFCGTNCSAYHRGSNTRAADWCTRLSMD